MARDTRFGKRSPSRRVQKLSRQDVPLKSRDIFRREERLRIAPKHPGMGRR